MFMSIKSQRDVKNANKAREEKVPKSMEGKYPKLPTSQTQPPDKPQPVNELSVNDHIARIEDYLTKVDAAFEKIATELASLRNIPSVIKNIDNEISKITGDIIRLTKLEEDRYIELATAINQSNDKITALDTYVPIYVDKRIEESFNELTVIDDDDTTVSNDESEPANPGTP
jgi:DNA repair exonuclease SbcCD ATPase subunit